MASEHRSAHEYGDVSLSRNGNPFGDNDQFGAYQDRQHSSAMPGRDESAGRFLDQKSKVTVSSASGQSAVLDRKSLFDQAASAAASQVKQSGQFSARSSQDSSLVPSGRGKYSKQQQESKSDNLSSPKARAREANQVRGSFSKDVKVQHRLAASVSGAKIKPCAESSESSSDSDSDRDLGDGGGLHSASRTNSASAKAYNGFKHIPHPPSMPLVSSYTNEKDKFEMALNSRGSVKNKSFSSPRNSISDQVGTSLLNEKERFEMALKNTVAVPGTQSRDKFELALQASTQPTTHPVLKEMFNNALQKENVNVAIPGHRPGGQINGGVPANVVGLQLAEGNGVSGDDLDLSALGLGLDAEFDLDALDFDIDKYLDLDLGELDEFLEKGWRPEDSPQIPQSSYPVLGKIMPAGNSGPVHALNNSNNSHNVSGKPPTGPPQQPSLAWRNSPAADSRGRPLQSPSAAPGVTALPAQPSPSPSSVASAAETLGGGTVKSKKDELVDEWGFKDSRTAEMMMARAKKMKWNAERRKKLNKLDPQQRLHLFRKLEESGKIQPVRAAAPARILPRKEYFQAREEEAQRQHLERRVEEVTRVHRTFEWLHTQVGDHPVTTSRINAGQAPVYSMNEADPGRQAFCKANQDNRKWSPGSDHLDSVSQAGGVNRLQQGRRYSIGDSQYSSQTPSLPPIQVGSAPSSHKSERMSFRDAPVERSGGWGGGKRRGQLK
ncbi:leucine-rich repeat and IQ domain-containing protein 1-like [Elysia marginata]|uniref:Leucine-rich repeat and IQ domain-containing protein 1-like n=1 Tax=Elysia marginata TaxID=1093978 RepID=A0AAV4JK00_9GAST|nr:leucine-rich repeat and IQ domain-containing protein 1-like [Elysia marginata]